MNYRHHFHAGNFADVMKHVLLVGLVHALQKKEKGFLYLDTHAGRGWYDLARAAAGDSLARQSEWPDGIGRLWRCTQAPPAVIAYLELVREFDRKQGNLTAMPRFYPGSPALAAALLRPGDRVVLCEKHPAECAALRGAFGHLPRGEVRESDGYAAVRALLPPRERRALVLLDPPYESPEEFALLVTALQEALRRFPTGVLAAWYPLTGRARVDEFLAAVRLLASPPTLAVELTIAGEEAGPKLRGCGLLVINPPWQFDLAARESVEFLAGALAQGDGGGSRVEWIVAPG
jgi:23S rRNA (adenine2030-N6)-methyltransferase